jgi:hypothetical protein
MYTADQITTDALVADARGAEQRFLYAMLSDRPDTDADLLADEFEVADDIACADAYAKSLGELNVGMYRVGDDIFKVQRSKTSEHLYAKKLVVIGGRRLVDADESVVNFEFEYAPGAMRSLTSADRLTLDDAKKFGLRYGFCCVCGKRLSDAVSVAAGIGPVCSKSL